MLVTMVLVQPLIGRRLLTRNDSVSTYTEYIGPLTARLKNKRGSRIEFEPIVYVGALILETDTT